MRLGRAALASLSLLLAACSVAPATISQRVADEISGTATSAPPTATGIPTPTTFVAPSPSRPPTPVGSAVASATVTARGTTAQPATPATRTPLAIPFNYRIEVRRTWTETSAGRDTVYFIDVAICNQTQSPQAIRVDALSVIVRPRGRPGAVGYPIKPQPTPDGGFTGTPTAQPGACAGGVVSLVPPQTEVPESLWYRRGSGPDAAESVALEFPE